MLSVIRIGDQIDCGDVIANGSSNVFANALPITRMGIDNTQGHCYSPVPLITGSSTVHTNNIPTTRITDVIQTHCCPGHGCHDGTAVSGSPNVFIDDQTAEEVIKLTVNAVGMLNDEIDDGTPEGYQAATIFVNKQIKAGIYKQEDIDAGTNAPVIDEDITPPADITPTGSCNDGTPPLPFNDSYPLTEKYTLGDITKKVTFPHTVQPNKGLTTEEIVCNLKLLTINCWTPIKAQYPTAFITNSFRPGNHEKQHGDGCAMDIQFKGIAKSEYFAIAQWIKDNVVFDRLLLEYKTTGTGLPWIHISFKQTPAKLVFTFMNDRKHSNGLVKLA